MYVLNYNFYVICIIIIIFIIFYIRQVDDDSYSWGQKSLGKDFYKDDSSSQFVSIMCNA